MIRAPSKTKTGKTSAPPPQYSPKGENDRKFSRAPEGMRTEELTDFQEDVRVFWGRIS